MKQPVRSALNRKTLPLDARVKSRTNRNKMIVDGKRGGRGGGVGIRANFGCGCFGTITMGRERVHLHENEIRTYQRDTISLFLLFRERIQSLKIPSIFFLSLSLSLFPIPSYLPPYEFSILYSMYQFVRIFYPVKDKIERAFDLLIRLIISTFFRIDEMTEEVLYGRR